MSEMADENKYISNIFKGNSCLIEVTYGGIM